MYTCVCFYLPDHRRSALSFFTMGSSCSNHLGIPPGNGPNAVGCTDFMMDHTAEVQAKENLCSCWHVTAEVTYLYLTFLSVLQMLGWVPTGIMESRYLGQTGCWHHGSKWPSAELLELSVSPTGHLLPAVLSLSGDGKCREAWLGPIQGVL